MEKDQIPAYRLLMEEDLGDIQSKGYLLCHKKSGAKVVLIENDDENKVFNIAFRTPPQDSTGIPHILEHSVLCGSRHFPLKDPFVELAKGSLNTFLNAMTFPDKTMYPVASCNDQDFQNLMHVYLDAVFFPNIYEREEIFRQEGWSYQIENTDAPLTYNGVVYNEMKGVFSSPEELLERNMMNLLFPDSPYGVESGGDPEVIPDLSYEDFLAFHKKYYHPSNCYIYLYGKMDMAEKLNFIDREYLSQFESKDISSEIIRQQPFASRREEYMDYPILEDEDERDNTFLAFQAVVGDSLDIQLNVAFQVLDYALLTAPGAPLKQALLDAGIGKDVYGSYDDGIYQPVFSLVAKNANEEDFTRFREIIDDTLQKVLRNGIPEKSLEAGIHSLEFRFREADYASYPKGLMYSMEVFTSWLYDTQMPFDYLKLLSVFQELRDKIGTSFFQDLVQQYLLDNTHAAYVILKPKKGMTAQKEAETAEKLQAYRDSLSPDALAELVEKTHSLKAYQEEEDSPEAVASVPLLKREDLDRDAGELYNEEIRVDDTLLLYHEVETNGIAYLNLYFDFSQIPDELLPYVGILKAVLGFVDTEQYEYRDLFNEINANTGGITCGTEFFEHASGKNYALFGMRSKALDSKLDFVFSMCREILFTSRLDQKKRLYEIIARLKSRLQEGIPAAGNSSAVERAFSYRSQLSWMQEQTDGIAFYQFLEQLEAEYEQRFDDLRKKLEQTMQLLFYRGNLMVSFTGCRDSVRKVEAFLHELRDALSGEKPALTRTEPTYCPSQNEGFMTSGQVQYVAQVGNFADRGLPYTGALQILRVILSYDYLWMNLRVKGGAYGCMSGFKRNGESYFVSYRDPHLKNTLQVYQGIPDYLRNFQADEREMTKYIIGTISVLDVPRTPKMAGSLSTSAWFSGITLEDLQKEREQILDAQPEDIRKLADLIEAVLANANLCVIGGQEAVQSHEELFGEIKNLILS